MTHFIVPFIAPEHYEAIRSLLNNDLPNTYDEWLQLRAQEREHITRRGNTVSETQIYPDDFARFARATNATPNLKTLENFAIEEAARKNK